VADLTPPAPLPAPFGARLSSSVVHAVKTAVVATGCYVVAPHLGVHEAYWAAISSIIVLQADVAGTFAAARDRLIGTAVGGAIGCACAIAWGGHLVVFAIAVALALSVCGTFGLTSAGRISGVTVAIITLLPREGPAWIVSLHRLWSVSFGVVVGLIVAVASARIAEAQRAEPKSGSQGGQEGRSGE
jgi:uncharacterized membrane protein YgaE (UPF0421/DUF939 family)